MKVRDLISEVQTIQNDEILVEGLSADIIDAITNALAKYPDQALASKVVSNTKEFMEKINNVYGSLKGEAKSSFMRTLGRMSGVSTYSKAVEKMSDMKAALTYLNGDSVVAGAIKELETLLVPIQKIRIT